MEGIEGKNERWEGRREREGGRKVRKERVKEGRSKRGKEEGRE